MTDASDADPNAARDAAVAEARLLLDAGLVSEMISEVHELASSVKLVVVELASDRLERTRELTSLRRRNAVLGASMLVSILLLGLLGWLGYTRLADIAASNGTTGRTLVECTTASPTPPSTAVDEDDVVHECYEDGVIRTAAAIASIGADVLDAAVCARTAGDVDAITACYRQRVAARSTSP